MSVRSFELLIVAALSLTSAGCGETPVEKAQKDLAFIQAHHGTDVEECAAEQKLADAYRDARDDKNYDLQALIARQCALNIELANRLKYGA